MIADIMNRWRDALAAATAARHEAIIYIDGPRTKWQRSSRVQYFEEVPGGLRVPHLCTQFCKPKRGKHDYRRRGDPLPGQQPLPEPHPDDVIQRRRFRNVWIARCWVLARLHGFDHTKIVGEVRSL